MKIQHLGIVVTNLDEALIALGLSRNNISETVIDNEQKNNLYFIHLPENNLWLEFVEPFESSSSVFNFARKNEIGLHHLAFENQNLENARERYSGQKGAFVLGSYSINVKSFGGNIRTLFIAVKGLILEFVSREKT